MFAARRGSWVWLGALGFAAACGSSSGEDDDVEGDAGSGTSTAGASSTAGANNTAGAGDGKAGEDAAPGKAGASSAGASASGAGAPPAAAGAPGSAGETAAGGAPELPLVGEHVFDREVLHEIAIVVAEEDLPSLDEHTDTRVPAKLVFDGVTLAQVGVRNKGQTSFQPTSQKPSFSIKINELVSGQRLDGLKKLVLNNTVQDPTWATELLTYDTYRKAGLPAPRVAHAVVSLNGAAKGIYTIVEAVNSQFLASYYGSSNDQGNLYEGPWDFTQSVDAADLKDELTEMRSRDDLQLLTDVALSKADAGYAARLSERLDVEQFIKGYAVDVVTVAWDGYAFASWNFYLYDNPSDGRFVFLPAGANWPYFRDQPEAAATIDPFELPRLWGANEPVGFLPASRVPQVAALQQLYEQYLAEVTKTAFDVPALNAEFDRLKRVLHSTKLKDQATVGDLEEFDDHIALAYDFVKARKQYLLTQLP